MGVAFAANLFTLFLFYEALTLVTYPLVSHKETAEAKSGGRKYIIYLLGAAKVLLLAAIIARAPPPESGRTPASSSFFFADPTACQSLWCWCSEEAATL